MYYKAHTKIIGDIKNKEYYAEKHCCCECCESRYRLSIHHHIKQNKRIGNERYTIELECNYSVLCQDCHDVLQDNESQYYRELFGVKTNKGYEYWHELKDDVDLEKLIEEYNNNEQTN